MVGSGRHIVDKITLKAPIHRPMELYTLYRQKYNIK
jgi:hypothetical protein